MNPPTVEVEWVEDLQRAGNRFIRVTLYLDGDTSDHEISTSMNPEFNEDIAMNKYMGQASTFEGAFTNLAQDIHRQAEFSYDQKMRQRIE